MHFNEVTITNGNSIKVPMMLNVDKAMIKILTLLISDLWRVSIDISMLFAIIETTNNIMQYIAIGFNNEQSTLASRSSHSFTTSLRLDTFKLIFCFYF